MASRTWQKPGIQSLDAEVKKLFGRVTFGSSVISSQDCLGFTVARTGTGTYTVTTDDSYPTATGTTASSPFFGIDWKLIAATATDGNIMVTSDYSPSTKAMTVKWMVGGSAADPAASAIAMIELTFRNISRPRKGA